MFTHKQGRKKKHNNIKLALEGTANLLIYLSEPRGHCVTLFSLGDKERMMFCATS